MDPRLHMAAIAALLAVAVLFARLPRPLFEEAAEVRHSRRVELALGVILAVAGVGLFESGFGGPPLARFALALVLVALIATAYADFRFLVIPDLYSLALALAALLKAQASGMPAALLGAVVCGGLLAAVAWAWRRTRAVEGLGFGDVKLGAALGALAGAEAGLWVIVAACVLAGAWALGGQALTKRKSEDGPVLIPLGAALAVAGGGWLMWSGR